MRKRPPSSPPLCPPPDRRVVMGIVGAPHGVRGEARVKSFTADPLAIADYGVLFSADGRIFTPLKGRAVKDDMLIIAFEGITSPEAVKALTGTELFIDRLTLPDVEEEDEFYHADLIGLAVEDAAGAKLGTITSVQNHGAGDILELMPIEGGATWLLPFTKVAVPRVTVKEGRVIADPAFLLKPEPARQDEDDGA